jgi:hypothetical protein
MQQIFSESIIQEMPKDICFYKYFAMSSVNCKVIGIPNVYIIIFIVSNPLEQNDNLF